MDGVVVWDSGSQCYRLIPSGADPHKVNLDECPKVRWVPDPENELGGTYEDGEG